MNNETINSDHWATDLKHTEQAANDFTDFVESTISDAIFKLKSNEPNQFITDSNLVNDDNKYSLDFDIPYFIKKYSIQWSRNYTSKTQKWMGNVILVEGDKFTAVLEDLNNPGTKEIGEFDIYDVSPDDKSLLKKGAAFYWRIGYNDSNGQRRKESIIKFRRLGYLTENDIDQIEDRAKSLYNSIKWNSQ